MKRFLAVVGFFLTASVAFAAIYAGVTQINSKQWFTQGLYVSTVANAAPGTAGNKVTNVLGNSATIDFSSASTGVALSSSITVTGAQAGDPCFVGVPTAAAALKAMYGCYVDAANSVKVWFAPRNTVHTSCTLVDGSSLSACAAQTVPASSVCTCTPVGATAAIAAGGCAVSVSSTTLTVTGPDNGNYDVDYDCAAPVDPASGTYYVRVISSQ